MAIYYPAPEVRKIAAPLVRQYHWHLIKYNVRMEYVYRDDVPVSKGREVWCAAKKVSSMNAYLANMDGVHGDTDEEVNEPFFCIWFAAQRFKHLDEEKRIALVDHGLMHCHADENEKGDVRLSINGYDYVGYNAEIERYGLWRADAVAHAKLMHPHLQLALEMDEPPTNGTPQREIVREKDGTTTTITYSPGAFTPHGSNGHHANGSHA